MSDTFLIIAIGAIGVGIGLATGLMVNSLRNQQRDSKQQRKSKASNDVRSEHKPQSFVSPPEKVTTELTDKLLPPQDQVLANRFNMNPLDVFARAMQPQVQPKQPLTRSIAEQVDEILQEILETSHLRSKAIRLLELPHKGMVVMIGLEQYQGVDAVPDEEVQSLIRSAVSEWERRVSEDNAVDL